MKTQMSDADIMDLIDDLKNDLKDLRESLDRRRKHLDRIDASLREAFNQIDDLDWTCMKTFSQLLNENQHVSAALRNTLPPELKDAIPSPTTHDTIASLRRSAAALEELIIVKAAVLDEARVALSDLREAIRKLENP